MAHLVDGRFRRHRRGALDVHPQHLFERRLVGFCKLRRSVGRGRAVAAVARPAFRHRRFHNHGSSRYLHADGAARLDAAYVTAQLRLICGGVKVADAPRDIMLNCALLCRHMSERRGSWRRSLRCKCGSRIIARDCPVYNGNRNLPNSPRDARQRVRRGYILRGVDYGVGGRPIANQCHMLPSLHCETLSARCEHVVRRCTVLLWGWLLYHGAAKALYRAQLCSKPSLAFL